MPRTGTTKFEDAVFGPREVQNTEIEDFVLLRSNGLPTYQLSVVVDDIDMRITHVIRGADHLSNTPKQALLYRALGAEPPIFAHVPLILGAGSHASLQTPRRHERGIVRRGGLSARGVSKFSGAAGMVDRGRHRIHAHGGTDRCGFRWRGVSRTNGVFDRAKLEWFNTQYLQKTPDRGFPALRGSGAKTRRALAGFPRRQREPAWFATHGGFDTSAHPAAARFHDLGSGVFHGRFRI